eukprot:NODE_823_length_1317_cov_104.085962_g602_i0.p2 GENE.NODE_823_length_1317_cov_104.085962_g602_i0~~NODE_823_length_1317_cov_104.085962_g602_i0.p2  ORF type:complete len:73 (+),score=13.02 NODE_823_length_1317_cov_104.085962_g602_i0:935-1153(+)
MTIHPMGGCDVPEKNIATASFVMDTNLVLTWTPTRFCNCANSVLHDNNSDLCRAPNLLGEIHQTNFGVVASP